MFASGELLSSPSAQVKKMLDWCLQTRSAIMNWNLSKFGALLAGQASAGVKIWSGDPICLILRGVANFSLKSGPAASFSLKGERQLKHQEELTVGTIVRRLDLSTAIVCPYHYSP